jgi:rhodanese-related sulfurtransferase
MAKTGFQRLSASEVAEWLKAHPGALILDARDEGHHRQGHLEGSLRLDGRNHERLLMREARDRPVLIYCYHGHASQTYADMFVDFGFQSVADLMGGWQAWMDAQGVAQPDQPVRRPARVSPATPSNPTAVRAR